MLPNPFIPSQMATDPNDFFGRDTELDALELSLAKSSVIVQGAMGIGKSSLCYQLRQRMEGFNSEHQSRTILVVINQDVLSLDDLARLVLERIVDIDQTTRKVTWKVPYINFFETENAEISSNFAAGRHLATLVRLLEREYIDNFVSPNELFIIAIDEAEKNPTLLARFVRTLLTETQGNGVANLRFIVSGVNPVFSHMVNEDKGVLRFFPSPLSLFGLRREKTEELLQTKFASCIATAAGSGFDIGVHPGVISRIAILTGGHPHIVQLLGSHVIDSENAEPDGMIDERDLFAALRRVCHQDRNMIYNDLLLMIENSGMQEAFADLMSVMSHSFPSHVPRELARQYLTGDSLSWFRSNNIIYEHYTDYYLDDELLKVRLILDNDQRFFNQEELEKHYTLMSDIDEPEEYEEEDDDAAWRNINFNE